MLAGTKRRALQNWDEQGLEHLLKYRGTNNASKRSATRHNWGGQA